MGLPAYGREGAPERFHRHCRQPRTGAPSRGRDRGPGDDAFRKTVALRKAPKGRDNKAQAAGLGGKSAYSPKLRKGEIETYRAPSGLGEGASAVPRPLAWALLSRPFGAVT